MLEQRLKVEFKGRRKTGVHAQFSAPGTSSRDNQVLLWWVWVCCFQYQEYTGIFPTPDLARWRRATHREMTQLLRRRLWVIDFRINLLNGKVDSMAKLEGRRRTMVDAPSTLCFTEIFLSPFFLHTQQSMYNSKKVIQNTHLSHKSCIRLRCQACQAKTRDLESFESSRAHDRKLPLKSDDEDHSLKHEFCQPAWFLEYSPRDNGHAGIRHLRSRWRRIVKMSESLNTLPNKFNFVCNNRATSFLYWISGLCNSVGNVTGRSYCAWNVVGAFSRE